MKRFRIVQNGYDIDEVNRFIDIVIRRLEKLDNENKDNLLEIETLKKKLEEKTNNSVSNTNEDIAKAIIAAQEASEKMKYLAKEEAKLIIEDAKRNANSILHEALVQAAKTENEASLLKKNITVYKNRIKNILKTQLEIAEEIDEIEL